MPIFLLWVLCLFVILWGSVWQNGAKSLLIIVVYVVLTVQIYRKHSLWSGGPWEGGGSCPVLPLEQKPWPQPNSPTSAQFLVKHSLPAVQAWARFACGLQLWLSSLLSLEPVLSPPHRGKPIQISKEMARTKEVPTRDPVHALCHTHMTPATGMPERRQVSCFGAQG